MMNLDLIKNNIRIFAGLIFIFCLAVEIFSFFNILQFKLITLYTLIFGFSGFSGLGALYFLVHEHNELNEKDAFPNQITVFRKILIIFFFISIFFCLILLNLSFYTKDILYYLIISFIVVIIIIQIIFLKDNYKQNDIAIILTQIVILSILIRGSSFYINPYIIGPDTLYHYHNIQQVVNTGYLSIQFYHYFYFPSYYLYQAIFGTLSFFSPQGFNILNLLTGSLLILISYLLGKTIFNNSKTGHIAGLLVSIAPMSIFCVVYNTSKIGGLFLVLLCLFIQIKIIQIKNFNFVVLFWISVLPLFLWHPELSHALIPILLAYSFILIFWYKRHLKESIYLSTGLILYIIIYVYYIFFVHISLGSSILDILFLEKSSIGLIQSIQPEIFSGYDLIFFIIQCSLAYIGITALTFFMMFIYLKCLQKPNKIKFFMIILLPLLLIIPLFGILTGKFGLGGERSLIVISVVITIFASGAFLEILSSRTWRNIALISLIFIGLSFFSVSSYLIGDGNDIFNDKIPIQPVYATESLMITHSFLNTTGLGTSISSDYESTRYLCDPQRGYKSLLGRYLLSLDKWDESDYIFINKITVTKSRWLKTKAGLHFMQDEKKLNIVYNNSNIIIFSKENFKS